MKKEFNILLSGIGGQGIITLTRILAEAALVEKYEVKTSELHGLSQRGGAVETHIRFGEKIYSPLIFQGEADLVFSLELQESLRACYYANKSKTIFLVNEFLKPILGTNKVLSSRIIKKKLEFFSKKIYFFPASKITKDQVGKEFLGGIYLLGIGVRKKILPLKIDSLFRAIEKIIPKKYLALNKKAFNLAFRN